LPDKTFDADAVAALRTDIGMLPSPQDRLNQAADAPQPETVDEAAQEMQPDAEEVTGAAQPPVAGEVARAEVDAGQPSADPFADMDMELLEIFVEEASEIMDSSANTLREWSKEPARRELMDEFQRQLHTLKGGARMVGIEAIGNLSHSVESLLTRVVDGHVETGTRLFDLLQDAHDRLADMLEQVRDSRMPEPVGELETALDRLGFETDGYDEVVEVVADAGNEAAATAEAMADQFEEVVAECVDDMVAEADAEAEMQAAETEQGGEAHDAPAETAPAV
jgi:chemosensory pili system protein ChpA (sensor histidine kinase/response regulator)